MCRSSACGCGGGGTGVSLALAVPLAVAAAVAVFAVTHAVIVAGALAVWCGVMGWLAARWRRRYGKLPPGVMVTASRAGGARAVTAPPKAVGGRRVVAGEVLARAEGERVER